MRYILCTFSLKHKFLIKHDMYEFIIIMIYYELKLVSYLGTIGLSPVTNLLPPTSTSIKNQTSSNTSSTQVGSTWAGSGLNIDLDNIMGGKAKQTGPAPTMNQLASNSPQHQIRITRESFFNSVTKGLLFFYSLNRLNDF